jgi:hypothetical protein
MEGKPSRNMKKSDARNAWYKVEPIPFRNKRGKMMVRIIFSRYCPLSFHSQKNTGTRKNNEE